ncbi:hypothetical protein GF386_01805 [Candidatus Pacearchaeota archaeon]|nr:hypothetical protein [Candidatus Pacearchaeota archaeon]MBD3282914.1 hypothetical protein [Candidatus Pacearchaeota archaeon]
MGNMPIGEVTLNIIASILCILGGAHTIYQSVIYALKFVFSGDLVSGAIRNGYLILSFYMLVLGPLIIYAGYWILKATFSNENKFHYYE